MGKETSRNSRDLGAFATSADGTRICYEVHGAGPPIILVGGILSDRTSLRPLAGALRGLSAVCFDRRGRGESTDGADYSVEKEVEDISALSKKFSELPLLFGHSSGAGLAIEAAAAGLPVAGLVLFEPPYGFNDDVSRAESNAFAESILALLAAGDNQAAIRHFFTALGLDETEVESLAGETGLVRKAPTMAYDLQVMGQVGHGGVVPLEKLAKIRAPALVLTGQNSPEYFSLIAQEVAEGIPDARFSIVPDTDHSASGAGIADIVGTFARSLW